MDSVYLIEMKEKPRKGKPGGDVNWRIDFGAEPIKKLRESEREADRLAKEFPAHEFQSQLYWRHED